MVKIKGLQQLGGKYRIPSEEPRWDIHIEIATGGLCKSRPLVPLHALCRGRHQGSGGIPGLRTEYLALLLNTGGIPGLRTEYLARLLNTGGDSGAQYRIFSCAPEYWGIPGLRTEKLTFLLITVVF